MERIFIKYQLDRSIWTEKDFDNMNWHDNSIHAISFDNNFHLYLDIDYIFEWVLRSKKYMFWISPCTLIFDNVYDLKIDIGPSTPEFEVDFITRSNPQRPKNAEYINRDVEFDWLIEMQQGTISFKAVGYRQYVRQVPKFVGKQKIDLKKRGGVSFDIEGIS